MNQTIIYAGIDNGVTGAICLLGEHPECPPIDKIPMPVQVTKKGREIDTKAVRLYLEQFGTREQFRIVIEEPGGSKSAKAAASMSASFGALRGAFQWAGMVIHRITPQVWQKALLGKCKDTKAAALTKAGELWPDESWLASDRCRVAHDGIVDSALIAYYGRKMKL